jgi:hypothetical protein
MESSFYDFAARAASALSSSDPAAKSRALDLLEDAIAFERAAAALAGLSERMKSAPWIFEIALSCRSSGVRDGNVVLRVKPSLGEKADSESNLPDIIDFAVAAGKLAHGTLASSEALAARQLHDSMAMRGAFLLGSRGLGFDSQSAAHARSDFAWAESELSKAMERAGRNHSEWLPHDSLGSNSLRRVPASECSSADSIARALGWSALAARLEQRTLQATTPASESPKGRPPAL